MNAEELFKKIEREVPLDLALNHDKVGFIGHDATLKQNIEKVLVLMDFIPQESLHKLSPGLNYRDFDLIVLHHPPVVPEISARLKSPEKNVVSDKSDNLKNKTLESEYPLYVAHSNWDIVEGGACDALADRLNIDVTNILDPSTRLGRIGNIKEGPISLKDFAGKIMSNLSTKQVNIVGEEDSLLETVALVSGFGLNSKFIKIAYENKVDVYLSGDLTHPGAILAKNLGINLIDATHHATEIPGLYRLGELISSYGLDVKVFDSEIPWTSINSEIIDSDSI